MGVTFAQAMADYTRQEGLKKHPDETDEDDGETDQDGVPGQEDVRMRYNGAVKDSKDGGQLQTHQNEHEAIQQKNERLPHGVRLKTGPRGEEAGGTPRQIEAHGHSCQNS